jgi:hypothetical protein
MRDLCLITDFAGPSVLLHNGPNGWELPGTTPSTNHWWQTVTPVNVFAATHGCLTTTLRCLRIIDDPLSQEVHRYYGLELREPATLDPAHYRWVGADQLLLLTSIEQREAAAAWLASLTSRVPWYNPGYAASAETWAAEQLARHGHSLTGPFEQVRSWERSTLWRVPTSQGMVYLKAVPPMFRHEVRLSAALAEWLPGKSAPVLAHNAEKGLLLLAEAGSSSLADTQNPQTWQQAIGHFAELQIALAERSEALLALGVPNRSLQHLPGRIAALFADEAALQRSPAGLNDSEIVALRKREGEFQAAWARLAAGNLPMSLEHGDFFPTQVLLDATDQPRFIDWSDSGVAHPFLSMVFLREGDAPLPAVADGRRFVRDAYLRPWERFASREQLEQLFDSALLLAPLHYALIYYQTILPAMENGWEMERMLPYYVRRAISDE